ncbi:MAG: hypothetical protein RQ783_05960 [Gammaproteobacteria bacterium]|nr:hypothetical protein [Gammaproteobacteria bacterium]
MSNITLTKPQIQAALDNLVSKPSGLNSLLEMTMNAFMKAERDVFLDTSNGNKANGYRKASGLGFGEGLALTIPRDRLSQFKSWIMHVMRNS